MEEKGSPVLDGFGEGVVGALEGEGEEGEEIERELYLKFCSSFFFSSLTWKLTIQSWT